MHDFPKRHCQRNFQRSCWLIHLKGFLEIIRKELLKEFPSKLQRYALNNTETIAAYFFEVIYWRNFQRNYRRSTQSNNCRGLQNIFLRKFQTSCWWNPWWYLRSIFYWSCRSYSERICCSISPNYYWRNLKKVICINNYHKNIEGIHKIIVEGV